MEFQADVIIVGAGIAGLSAARALQEQGQRVIVLEADTKPGGRIKAQRFGDDDVQMGAFLLHTLESNALLGSWFDAADVAEFKDGPLHIYQGEARLAPSLVRRQRGWIRQALWSLHRKLDRIPPEMNLQDAVFNEILEAQGERPDPLIWQSHLERWATVEGEDAEAISLFHLLDHDDGSGGNGFPPGGMHHLVERMVSGLDIRVDMPVTSVDWSQALVRVSARDQVFEAPQVLVTVSLGVLRSEVLHFEPTLPDYKRNAMQRMGFGLLNKVMFYYQEPFWKPGARSWSLFDPEQHQSISYTTFCHPDGKVLTIFVGGNRARTWEHLTDEQLETLLLNRLRTCLGSHIPEPDEILRTRWGQEPWQLGGYSYLPLDAHGDEMEVLAEPLKERLYFAGEACVSTHYGTVHGAYESGLAAAEKMIRASQL